MNLFESKVFAIVTLCFASAFVGILPACFTRHGRQQWPVFLSTLLCFGGGVLLSTSMVHILPEMRKSFPEDYANYAELIFCSGFFILYMLDEIVHYFYGDPQAVIIQHSKNQIRPEARRSSMSSAKCVRPTERDPLLLKDGRQPPYNPSFYRTRSDSVLFCDEPPSQICHVAHQEPCNAAPTANIGLLVALAMHSLLEGLVVGLESEPNTVLLLLGAISSHKLVVAFCLGMELASNEAATFCKHFTYILIFSIGSSVGIILGMTISSIPAELNDIIIPILQGLAGGTLLYVTVSEIIPRERARWHKRHNKKAAGIYQFLSVGIGFLIMTCLGRYLNA